MDKECEMVSFNIKIPAAWRVELNEYRAPEQRTLAAEIRVAIGEHLKRKRAEKELAVKSR